MGECHRVLKPGRWLSLCYHDSSARRWAMVQDLMRDAGFAIDSTAAAGSIETGQKSFNQWMSNKATKRDLVISFRKPRPGQPRPIRPAVEFEAVARQVLSGYLAEHGSADKGSTVRCPRQPPGLPGPDAIVRFEVLLRSLAEEDGTIARPGMNQVWKLKPL